jgi:predicted transcriptional regulator of viral defense system
MGLQQLFASKPVLTHAEVLDRLDAEYSSNRRSQEALLRYHLSQGNLRRVRRGLYAVVPPGATREDHSVDPYLVAAKLAEDAVLAYHTALEFHGKAYTVFDRYVVQSRRALRPTTFDQLHFEGVPFPKPLRDAGQEFFATKLADRQGVDVRVAQVERALVDALDRPKLSGGWEEVWRSLELVEYFDLDLILAYVNLLDNATTTAKVGFYLEQHAEALWVEEKHLAKLRKRRPKQPHYLVRGRSGKLVSAWNLVVPPEVLERRWEEVL